MSATGDCLTASERAFLLHVQLQGLQYFLDNQMPNGLMLDRQSNHGPRRSHGLCSTSATGMGFIALALAVAPPYRLLSPESAVARIRAGVSAALDQLPHDHGAMPHFVHSATGEFHGCDPVSTIDSSWLVAGALWAAAFLGDPELQRLAARLYERVDWHFWTAPGGDDGRGLLRHGKGRDGHFLAACWDRVNGETVFMYVLAAGAHEGRAVPAASWHALQPFYGTVAGRRFNNADLGLFVFQYGMDLLDLCTWRPAGAVDLWAEARLATAANREACHAAGSRFATYRRFWGLSAGDGPGHPPAVDVYRCYTPAGPVDGTAHLTATLAAVAHDPGAVLENLRRGEGEPEITARGRYGFSSVNVDRGWAARDMVGIDAGAAVLAVDNFLADGRVRSVFHTLGCVQAGLERLGFTTRPGADAPLDGPSVHRLAS
jgi:hypothetical protein